MNLDKRSQNSNIGLFRAGNCYFKLSIEKMLQKYGKQTIQKFKFRLENQTLKIRSAVDYIQKPEFWQAWKFLLQQMVLCDMQNFYASYSPLNKKILKQIRHIQFGQLLCLELNSNHLTNVETLYMIKAPNLKYIWLNNNRITILKTLFKSYFYNLEQIHLENNYDVFFCYSNFSSLKSLKDIFLPYSLEKGSLEYDISGLMKLQTSKLKIKTQTDVFLNQAKVKKMLMNKCNPKIN